MGWKYPTNISKPTDTSHKKKEKKKERPGANKLAPTGHSPLGDAA